MRYEDYIGIETPVKYRFQNNKIPEIVPGIVSSYNNTKVTKDQSVTIKAETNEGYTFIGWYDGDNELTKELSYTFTMPAENLVYTAKFTANTNTTYKVD